MAQPKDSGDTEGQDGQSIVLKGKPDDLLAMVDEDMGLSTLGEKNALHGLPLAEWCCFLIEKCLECEYIYIYLHIYMRVACNIAVSEAAPVKHFRPETN